MRRTRGAWERLKRGTRYQYLRVLRTKAPSSEVARGVACGVFGGCLPALPPIPLQTLAAVLLAFIVRGSKIPAAVCTWVSNPLNWLAFYWVQFKIGSLVLPFKVAFNPREMALADYFQVGWQGLAILMAGGLVLAVPLSVGTYFVAHPLIRAWRRRRALRVVKKRIEP